MPANKTRAFVARPRCIYSGDFLDPTDPELAPSPEHIVPMSLGGSNQFVTNDVSRRANNRAGNEIDDRVASLFTVTTLRNQYKLVGHRGIVPDVKIAGQFEDISSRPDATMVVKADGSVEFVLKGSQTEVGQTIQIAGGEDWVAKMLSHRLKQAKHHGGFVTTPLGDIKDEEDIKTAITLATGELGEAFKATLSFDIMAHQRALQHFVVKLALCVGHKTFGPEWTFGPDGNLLRKALFPSAGPFTSTIRGNLSVDVAGPIEEMLDMAKDRHSIAVFRFGDKAITYIALFGGVLGVAGVALSQSAKKYRTGALRKKPEGLLYQLSGMASGKPSYQEKSLTEMMLNVSSPEFFLD